MPVSIVFAALWVVCAFLLTLRASKRHHWPEAYGLIAVGIPILVWVFREAGSAYGIAVALAGASVLRWPLWFLLRWLAVRVRSLWPGRA